MNNINKKIKNKETKNDINKEKEKYGNNIIECILDIKLNEKDIILFNESEGNKNEIKDNINVYLNNKRINIKKEGYKWKLDYNFEKEGKYNIKIIFKNNQISQSSLFYFFNGCSLI